MNDFECETAVNKSVDRFNPFSNSRENRFYSDDYRKIEPLISFKDFSFSVKPSPHEKKNIRKSYNRAGCFLLLHIGMSTAIVVILVILAGIMLFAYPDDIETYMSETSIEIGISAIAYLITNIAVFFIGCGVCGFKKGDFFRKSLVSDKTALFRYIILAFFMQVLSLLFYSLLVNLFPWIEVEDTLSPDGTPRQIFVNILYTCIAAPITEELVFRGIILKNLSKASQGFGIFASALLFGLVHGNIPQFINAFLCGIILGHAAIKYNSLTPCIVIHMCINIFATLMDLGYTHLNEDFMGIFEIVYMGFMIAAGLAVLIYSIICRDIMPVSCRLQRKRALPVALTSWSLILVTAIYLIIMITSC